MNFEPNADQTALVDAVEQIVRKYGEPPKSGAFHYYAAALDAALRGAGFFDVARDETMGGLEAALVVEAVCKSPACVEAAASALLAPMVLDEPLEGPVALVADTRYAARFLGVARNAFVLQGDDAFLLDLDNVERKPVESLFAYPMARFAVPPDLSKGRHLTAAQNERLRNWWRVAIAVEAAATMQAAVEFTVEYVSQRRQFDRALGAFQAIQHRLSECTVSAQATRWLAREAAWKGDAGSAAVAATYAQYAIPAVVHDLHQFNGALGITLDHPLHYWTYRLRALQAELGGAAQQALAATHHIWLAAS